VAEKDRLYSCLDRIVEQRAALFQHLRQRWEDLFDARFDVLLYDLTSTYFEGLRKRFRRRSEAIAGTIGRTANRSCWRWW